MRLSQPDALLDGVALVVFQICIQFFQFQSSFFSCGLNPLSVQGRNIMYHASYGIWQNGLPAEKTKEILLSKRSPRTGNAHGLTDPVIASCRDL